ncbi:MAG TPA: universal stress protein [Candidatus Hydrogenedens sp.]|nr:universal stress protein [Candidatus Hydrogenedens sp.]HOK09862.1 universal stress protein [Candidatus Hydrogenedens sp.]HOL19522.1 universal stress protein [Candidatus Hydrogenedens sp.]HPP59374.1 universal stress protein [Candidatus Hydrogenedens sp.]
MSKENSLFHVLFCTDFSENADIAFDYALDLVLRRPQSILTILHVIPEPEAQFWKTYIYEVENLDEKARQDIDNRIAQTYLSKIPPEVAVLVEIRIGRDYQTILEFANERKVDMIVMGRRGHSTWERPFFGSVTERVVRRAECPVLVVPRSAKK